MKAFLKLSLASIIGFTVCGPISAIAKDVVRPPTYEKCVGSQASAPIPKLLSACNTALAVSAKSYEAIFTSIQKKKNIGELVSNGETTNLDQWIYLTASSGYHSAKWAALYLGIKRDDVCTHAAQSTALFASASRQPEHNTDFYKTMLKVKFFDFECQKSPRNSPNDALWGLSVPAMKKLVQAYNKDPKAQKPIHTFTAGKFIPLWNKSSITNGFKPLRSELNVRYKLAKAGLTEEELTTLESIYYQGLKSLDNYNDDKIPDFTYSWLRHKRE